MSVCLCLCVCGNEQLCSHAPVIWCRFDWYRIHRALQYYIMSGQWYIVHLMYIYFFLPVYIGMTRALCRHRNNCPYRKFWMIPRGFRWHYYIIIIVGGKRGYNIIIFINNINYLLNVFFELFNSTKNLPIENKIWSYVSVSIFSPFI